MPIRLLLVDDHPIVLQGLQRLFEQSPEFEVAGTCGSGPEAIERLSHGDAPDVLVIDVRMPGMTGLDVLRAAGRGSWKSVVLTAAIRDDEIAQVLELGASGIVLKESSPSALLECVRHVYQGRRWIDPEMLARGVDAIVRPANGAATPAGTLTPREREVIRLVAEGLRNREIAQRLAITEGTVKIHLHNIYDKLGVDGRLELVLAAQQKGLV